MAIDQVAIYNMALSSIGTAAVVAAADESSAEADELNIWYEVVRDRILGAAFWPSVRATARLALLSTRDTSADWAVGDPEPGWSFAYARPSDMLRPRFLSNYGEFILGLKDINTPTIITNQETPLLIYTARQPRVDLWDADMQYAIAHALGSVVCLKLTGSKNKRDAAWQIAYDLVMQARVNNANSINRSMDFAPSAMIARGYADPGPASQYVYPYAEVSASGFGNVN